MRTRPQAGCSIGTSTHQPAEHRTPGGTIVLFDSAQPCAPRERLMTRSGPRLRGAADTSPVSACDCHLVPRPRPRDLPDPHCRRCLGSGEVARG